MSDIVERLRASAELMTAWDKWEMSTPVPARMDFVEIVRQLNTAADELEQSSSQVERANKHFADILDAVDWKKIGEIEKIATRAMLECQGYPLTDQSS